ncbi:putative JmjC domain-containing histone demethylation protein 2C [Liparis tanakae]|uniref:Putative JmjC domain-containing histone demethylation protein 2C n=1 Tax=Liparis tanakae TaxID=230148 RepID=A0A4Z2HAF1_9TELE|nr:putative JmjC domain-containing histone demethylation protein 2C [Liparis tanakae]
MPNILDDIIASVVENKIPAGRQSITTKLSIKHEPVTLSNSILPAAAIAEDAKPDRKKLAHVTAAAPEESTNQYPDVPHCWLNNRRLLWLKDHRNQNNWRLFRECWRQGQPVLVSGIHKRLNGGLWKADSFNQEFADHQGDLLNCKDQVVSNSGIKEFWDGFEDITKRPKSKDGEPMVYRLKDWPSGEEFMALMPSRYDDLMKNLPLPEYSDPEGNLNLASHLPSFFVRPDLGPRLCCAYGVAASQDQDFGTANLHVEVSDVVSILVYVGVAKGNGVLSKTGVLKRLEEEDLDEGVRRRLKDSSETPGALWHIYLNQDMDTVREFLHKVQNLHSCVQVINDFVSPEHVANSFQLTQELRPSREEVNYEDKLQSRAGHVTRGAPPPRVASGGPRPKPSVPRGGDASGSNLARLAPPPRLARGGQRDSGKLRLGRLLQSHYAGATRRREPPPALVSVTVAVSMETQAVLSDEVHRSEGGADGAGRTPRRGDASPASSRIQTLNLSC